MGGDRLEIAPALRARMIEMARTFRKTPTVSEEKLWSVLRKERSPGLRFRRQHPIGPFVVDFYCALYHLIVEVDGPIHEQQREQDRARQELLEACGYAILRVSAAAVDHDLPAVLRTIINTTTNLRPESLLPAREKG